MVEKHGKNNLKESGRGRAVAEVALGAALVCVCSLIRLPLAVPITLQTLGVFLVIFILGEKKAAFCVLAYVCVGLLGLPVFSHGGGVQALFSVTGGYLVGLAVLPLVCLILRAANKKRLPCEVGCAAGLLVCYAVGAVWYGAVSGSYAISVTVLPFILPDALKLLAASFIGRRVKNALKRT